MANTEGLSRWLTESFPALVAEHEVPGAAIGILVGGEVLDAAAGVLNTATGVDATTDSLFQIGSITKVWTASLIMQLVDEGQLELDAPVHRYLPDFRVSDEDASATMTLRQLLSHTAGFEGDVFTDTGRGDDCVEKYVASLTDLEQLFPPGELFSYNNAGFCVLGRIVEVLRDKSFDDCLREYLFSPLGLTHAATSADEAILHRAAVGHLRTGPDGEQRPAPVWSLVRSNGPAGSALAMRPRDLLAFARMHFDGGTAADGTRVLSAESVKAMQEHQVELPQLGMMGTAWGLGWELYDWPGGPVLGHDGGTIGQAAFLRIVPGHDVAIALQCNGGDPISFYRAVYEYLLPELTGIELPPFPQAPAEPEPFDATRYVGTYACEALTLTVSQDEDRRVWGELVPRGVLAEFGSAERFELVRLDGDTLVQREATHGIHQPHVFLGDDGTGRAEIVHTGRVTRRGDTASPGGAA